MLNFTAIYMQKRFESLNSIRCPEEVYDKGTAGTTYREKENAVTANKSSHIGEKKTCSSQIKNPVRDDLLT
jgi:hypothetical protein